MDTMYLSIKQLLDIWFVSTFWLLWIMLLWTFLCKFLCRYMFSLFLGTYIVVEKLDHMVTLHLISRGTARPFLKVVALFYIPAICESCESYESTCFSISLSTLVNIAILVNVMEKEMGIHSSILSWRILWTEKPGGLLSMESHRVRHDWTDLACMHWRRKWQPIPVFLPGESMFINEWTSFHVCISHLYIIFEKCLFRSLLTFKLSYLFFQY